MKKEILFLNKEQFQKNSKLKELYEIILNNSEIFDKDPEFKDYLCINLEKELPSPFHNILSEFYFVINNYLMVKIQQGIKIIRIYIQK